MIFCSSSLNREDINTVEKMFQKEGFRVSVDNVEQLIGETGTRLFSMDMIGENLPGRKNNTKITKKVKKKTKKKAQGMEVW